MSYKYRCAAPIDLGERVEYSAMRGMEPFETFTRKEEGLMRARRLLLGFGVAGAGLLFAASSAWACTNLATLNLSNAAGTSGQSITVTGSSFSVASATAPATPVVLH